MSSSGKKKVSSKAEPQLPPRPADAVDPPHGTMIHFKARRLEIRVTLHKIPESCIRVHATSTHFHLDTLKYSKKYYLSFEYPRKIKVDENNVEADLAHGVLTVQMPILQILDQETGKLVKFGVTADDSEEEKPKNKKHTQTQTNPTSSASQAKPKQKAQQPIASDSVSEDYNIDDEAGGDDEDEEDVSARKQKKPQQRRKLTPEQKKMYQERKKPVELGAALRIADQIADKQLMKAEMKLEKQASRDEFFEKKEEAKAAKKARKEQIKKQVLDKIVQEQKQKRKDAQDMQKKVPKRKIRFDDEKTNLPTGSSKKAKRMD